MSPPSSKTSRKPEPARRLIVSFHDLHPGSRGVCARFLDQLRTLGIEAASLLLVPRWHGAEPFIGDEEFTAWVQSVAAEGHDICLHGFFHRVEAVTGNPLQRMIGRHYTQGEGEFFQIDAGTACDRLRRGLSILAQAGLGAHGFTAPAWLLSSAGRAALVEAGFHYTTTFREVHLLQRGETLSAPTIVYSSRRAWRRVLSRAWAPLWGRLQRSAPILRIAAHPGDFADPRVETSLLRQVRRALADGRVPTTYRDLLPNETSPVLADPLAAA